MERMESITNQSRLRTERSVEEDIVSLIKKLGLLAELWGNHRRDDARNSCGCWKQGVNRLLQLIGTWELGTMRGVERNPGKAYEPSVLTGLTFCWGSEMTMDRQPHR